MPARARKIGKKWRVVEPDGTLVSRGGNPVDGGGHNTREEAMAQATAINMRQAGVPAKKKRKRARTRKQRRERTILPS